MKKDLTGQRFNRLTVINCHSYSKTAHSTLWECECVCGKKTIVSSGNLKTGHTKSCGCYQEENKGKHSLTHGHTIGRSATKTYVVWSSMLSRCNNQHNEKYRYYGGRGIKVCERWNNFINFLDDMGESPNGKELDRINNNLGYFKDNCRWTTKKINMRNKKNNNIVSFNGYPILLIELSEKLNIPYHALRRRILGWGMSTENAILSCSNLRKVGINKKCQRNF